MEIDKAEEDFKFSIRISEDTNNKSNLGSTYIGLAESERLRGNFNEALFYIREAARVSETSIDLPTYQIQIAKVYLAMGQPEIAQEHLDLACKQLEKEESAFEDKSISKFLIARAYFESGNLDEAEEKIQEALSASAKLGYDQFLVLAGRESGQFLEEITEKWTNNQLDSILKRIREYKEGIEQFKVQEVPEDYPDQGLEIIAFGSGKVRLDGELISNNGWRSSRARALFFYIVDKKRVRKEDIALEFWPDFSPSKISSNFHATLWRVRKALGEGSSISFEDDLYSIHPSFRTWYDVNQFEALVAEVNKRDVDELRQIQVWQQAIEIYTGDFLEDVFMDWAEERRAELREKYINCLINIGTRMTQLNRLDEAKNYFQKALGLEPYRDDVHLLYMQALVTSGAVSSAKVHYQEYNQRLKKELETEPTPELRNFFNRIS